MSIFRNLGSPAGQLFSGLLQGGLDWWNQQQANQYNEDLFGRIDTLYGNLGSRTSNEYNSLIRTINRTGSQSERDYAQREGDILGLMQDRTNDLLGRYNSRQTGILNRYEADTSRILGQLEGLGAQERADLAQQFSAQRGRTAAGLRERGLSGTTIAPSLQAGVAREESNASTRLNDALNRERLGILDSRLTGGTSLAAGLSGDTLGALGSRYGGMDTAGIGLSGDRLNAANAFNQLLFGAMGQRSGALNQLGLAQAGSMEGRRAQATPNPFGQAIAGASDRIGAMNVQQQAIDAQRNNWWQSLIPSPSFGFGMASGAASPSWLFGLT